MAPAAASESTATSATNYGSSVTAQAEAREDFGVPLEPPLATAAKCRY